MTKRWTMTGILCIFMLAATTYAEQTSCPDHFAGGQAPDLVNQKLATKARDICYSGFALKHSGITRTPLYSAEHLTRDRLAQAKGMKRNSKFYPDPNLPVSERAELRQYARSGYDRGHVAPSGDMPDEQSQQESFSLANMVPQVPENNRGVWEGIESAVRKLAKDRGDLYVVSGPIYQGDNILRIGGAVMVPTQLYKAVYDPARQEAGAYLVDNAVGAQPVTISITELEKITGISLFPAVSDRVKVRVMRLTESRSYKERKKRRY
jgi:endonuclease G, mitochondrial